MKEEEVINLGNQLNFDAIKASPLKLEASGREYWRIFNNKNHSLVLCYLDPGIGEHFNFIKTTNCLSQNNISCPNIIHHNKKLGVTLQEDLGDNDLLSLLNHENKDHLLENSLDLLIQIQNSKIDGIDRFGENELKEQMISFKKVFCEKFLKMESSNFIDVLISDTIDNLDNHPWVNCHFDFERRNLILNKNNDLTVIDYQDMRIGPMGIDLAGILIDHYYEIDFNDVKNLLTYYSENIQPAINKDKAFEYITWGSIQRNIRILGTLANLYIEHNRAFRIKDLPMILSNLILMIPDEYDCKIILEQEIKPLLNKRIGQL